MSVRPGVPYTRSRLSVARTPGPLGYRGSHRSQFNDQQLVLRASQNTQSTSLAKRPWLVPGYKNAVVSQQPEGIQQLVLAGIAAGLWSGTAFCCSGLGPLLAQFLPSFLAVTKSTGLLCGPTLMAAGLMHFIKLQECCTMYPHQGAWGCWNLPGSAEFHVSWTGAAYIVGGAGLAVGALPSDIVPEWLSPASAFGLFMLTIAVTPSNVYMYTHNAPGPIPEDVLRETGGVVPAVGHLARGVLQVVLLSVLWGIATA